MTDPIADMLTRIRNAILGRKAKVQMPASNIKHRLAEVLRDEGFLTAVSREDDDKQGILHIELRYDNHNRNAIEGIRRRSRPGQRLYVHKDNMPKVRSGLGVAILTTSKGLLTDRQARSQGVGGEVLCEVW
jgi:small subunit ribosomal protein S8